jgi:hypothetical protein
MRHPRFVILSPDSIGTKNLPFGPTPDNRRPFGRRCAFRVTAWEPFADINERFTCPDVRYRDAPPAGIWLSPTQGSADT